MSSTLTRVLAPAERPDLARWQAARPGCYPAFLESAAAGLPLGRYDILLRAGGSALVLGPDGIAHGTCGGEQGFLASLDAWWQAERIAAQASQLPFQGGWCLYLGYELAAEVEPRLRLPTTAAPRAYAIRCPGAVIYDHLTKRTTLVAERGHAGLLDAMEADLREAPPSPDHPPADIELIEDDPRDFLDAVVTALDHIGRGDIYQANLSRKWQAAMPPAFDGSGLYRRLRRANPGPFAGIMTMPGLQVLSTSPERLVEVRDGWAQTRPIAGTRPRATGDPSDDAAAIAALVDSAKERAEHVMLIDLERNDLGRICEAGTVTVSEFGVVESYAHVHHLVSNVRGKLRAEVTPGGVIRALFPGGTITGCPKVRCMEIISAIEGQGRGAYTGSFGYLNRDGSMDLNILIRTATLTGGMLEIRAGAGIVADSHPERELDETRAKARGLLRGLGLT